MKFVFAPLAFVLLATLPVPAQHYQVTRWTGDHGFLFDFRSYAQPVLGPGQDDVLSAWQTLPFGWTFFGRPVDGYFVSDNGYITFDAAATASIPTNTRLPDPGAPMSSIFAFWTDLTLGRAQGAWDNRVWTATLGAAPNRVHVIYWLAVVPAADAPDRASYNFALALYENGSFETIFTSGRKSTSVGATIGAVGADGRDTHLASMDAAFPDVGYGGDDDRNYLFEPIQSDADAAVARVRSHPKFARAMAALDEDHDRLVQEIITLTQIPAPPFMEEARGTAYLEMLRDHGLSDVERDGQGNVMGLRRGSGGGPLIVVAAHLDTVFPEGTDVTVTREGTRLMAPGIGDDTRSLAVLLAMIRAMDAADISTEADILFVGDVGEEGVGDLSGMKYLFREGKYKDDIAVFISMDGAGDGSDVTRGAVGSKRYRATFAGPGGHSYGAFGLVSPAFAMGAAIAKFSDITVPDSPKTTLNVGVVGGGTSVNSIPFESWMDVDMRSVSPVELERLEQAFLRVMQEAADEENRVRSTSQGPIEVDLVVIGDRPSGETPLDSRLVQTAAAAIRAVGMTPTFGFSSTDSNIPISMGIPAITIDSGGSGGRAHALDEWIDVEKTASLRGIESALTLLLALAGIS
jgi:acetylornithine deacetylase/succinyl-diaminopimelate desuccinylase-like protein